MCLSLCVYECVLARDRKVKQLKNINVLFVVVALQSCKLTAGYRPCVEGTVCQMHCIMCTMVFGIVMPTFFLENYCLNDNRKINTFKKNIAWKQTD